MRSIYVVGGECIFHDPGPEMIQTFLAMDQGFRVESMRPPKDFIPKFHRLRKRDIFLEKSPFEYTPEDLKRLLDGKTSRKDGERLSALDILYVLCLRSLNNCSWCGWNCKANRFSNEKGNCGLSSIVYSSPSFTHIAEEVPINPSLVTNLGGCAMHCLYCIEHRLLDTPGLIPLDTKKFWQDASGLVDSSINSIEFTNPTESLHGILHILLNAPEDFHRPVVMNCHLYGSRSFYQLADPIADAWLPDLRYGNNECAKSLSGVDHYMEQVTLGLDSICKKGNRVIARILILPGHISCCIDPALKLLAKYKNLLLVSVLDQYVPEYKSHLVPGIDRRPTKQEIEQVNDLVKKYGLRDVAECGGEFWD